MSAPQIILTVWLSGFGVFLIHAAIAFIRLNRLSAKACRVIDAANSSAQLYAINVHQWYDRAPCWRWWLPLYRGFEPLFEKFPELRDA